MAAALPEDSTLLSDEFAEYEREFQKYTGDNLRSQQPGMDFLAELCDEPAALAEKAAQLIAWWRSAGHVVVYTGAGVSTAAGLPDYRGPSGVWTRKLRGEAAAESDLDAAAVAATPTRAHEVVARLHAAGRVAFVATTNVDDLHARAGLPREALSELHGNMFVEECQDCRRQYHRDEPVRTATRLREHATGRLCEACGAPLRDTIVNFGNTAEEVPSMEAEHDRTWVQCLKADLVVVLGSSLSVPTACDLPEECLPPRFDKPDGGRLVIVNRQRTPKDSSASLCIHAACDHVLGLVEQALLGGSNE